MSSTDTQEPSNNSSYIVLFVLILVSIVVFAINLSMNSKSDSAIDNSSGGNSRIEATIASQNQMLADQSKCLDRANQEYKNNWASADADGDGKLTYNDGATVITTSYYDAQISCYRNFSTANSDSSIIDLQQKRQQEVDKYNVWVVSNSRRSSNCTAYNYGIDDRYTSISCY